jgi:ATP-dependent Lon protease
VDELGEDALPEPPVASTASGEGTVETQAPPPNEPAAPETAVPRADDSGAEREVTTEARQPLRVPDSIHVRITPENLKEYVGPPVYHKDRLYSRPPPPGVSTGLGYLGNGSGAVMPIEATSMPGKGSLQLTGKLGEVIRESAQIALSWVKAHSLELGIVQNADDQFLNDRDIHVHMPEGSIGKEGPSAGTALLTAFVSLFTKTRVSPDIGTCVRFVEIVRELTFSQP